MRSQPLSDWARIIGLIGSVPLVAAGTLMALMMSLWAIFLAPLWIAVFAGIPALLVWGALRTRHSSLSGGLLMLAPCITWMILEKYMGYHSDPYDIFHPVSNFGPEGDRLIRSITLTFCGAGGFLALVDGTAKRWGFPQIQIPGQAGVFVIAALGVWAFWGPSRRPYFAPITVKGRVKQMDRFLSINIPGTKIRYIRRPHPRVSNSLPLNYETISDAQGAFSLELPPSYYRLEITHPNYETLVREEALTRYNEIKTFFISYEMKPNSAALSGNPALTPPGKSLTFLLKIEGQPASLPDGLLPKLQLPGLQEVKRQGDHYVITGLLPKKTSFVNVFVDAEPKNPEYGPGDILGSVIVVPSSPNSEPAVVDLHRLMHLLSPVDNGKNLAPCTWCKEATLLTNPVHFQWESLGPDMIYEGRIWLKDCTQDQESKVVETNTRNTQWTISLKPNAPNEQYTFSLLAYRRSLLAGTLVACHNNPLRYGFPFRIE